MQRSRLPQATSPVTTGIPEDPARVRDSSGKPGRRGGQLGADSPALTLRHEGTGTRPKKSLFLTALLLGGLVLVFAACKTDSGKASQGKTGPYYDHGIAPLTEAVEKSPNKAEPYFKRGNALNALQLDSLALVDYQKAISLDSTKAEYFSALGDLLIEHQDISGSLPYLEKAIALNPKDPKARLNIAKMMLISKDYPKAFTEINTVLRQDVYNPEAYFLKGMVYKDMGDTSKARSSFETALNVSPNYQEAAVQLGMIYLNEGNPLGLQYLENASRMDTTDVLPLYALGMYYQQKEDWENAKASYRRALQRNRTYADALYNTGYVLLQQDSFETAIGMLDQVLELGNRDFRTFYLRGLAYELLGNDHAAGQDYLRAKELDKNNPDLNAALKRVGK